jgi:hypothetical protein
LTLAGSLLLGDFADWGPHCEALCVGTSKFSRTVVKISLTLKSKVESIWLKNTELKTDKTHW